MSGPSRRLRVNSFERNAAFCSDTPRIAQRFRAENRSGIAIVDFYESTQALFYFVAQLQAGEICHVITLDQESGLHFVWFGAARAVRSFFCNQCHFNRAPGGIVWD